MLSVRFLTAQNGGLSICSSIEKLSVSDNIET